VGLHTRFTLSTRDTLTLQLLVLYAGCSAAKAIEVTSLMLEELEKVAADGITRAELELAQGNISGSLALKFETNQARMSRLSYRRNSLG
jgi:predicted Zn-dependent peptidase